MFEETVYLIFWESKNSDVLCKKEEMFFDLWPEKTSDVKDEIFQIPYEIIIRFENDEIKKYILPVWTPIQRLPIDKVKVGSVLEVWQANGIENIMRVLQV